MNYTLEGIAKALMYGSYLQNRMAERNETAEDAMQGELDNYPYQRKKNFQVFLNFILIYVQDK